MAHSRLRMSRKSWRKRQRDKDLARGTIWTILQRHFRPLRPVGAFCRNSKREKTLRRMICNRSAETRRRGSLMVREVGCSTNLALWKGLMAATSRTMVKWSASSTVREAPDSLCYWIACHPYAEPADGGLERQCWPAVRLPGKPYLARNTKSAPLSNLRSTGTPRSRKPLDTLRNISSPLLRIRRCHTRIAIHRC